MSTAMAAMPAPPPTLVGRRAPDFSLACTRTPNHPAPTVRLEEYRDRWLILMFYPRDFSLVCPTELSGMSNRYDEFASHGADVLALSTDEIETHERWLQTPKTAGGIGSLRFPLASDPGGVVARSYQVYLESQRLALRGLFIIDPNSVIQYQVVHNLSVGRPTEDVMRVLMALQTGGLCPQDWKPGTPTIDPSKLLKKGDVISHYRIDAEIGAGSFATVYRAHDELLQRPVALKVLRNIDNRAPSIKDEARAVAALNHPNVCTIYNIDDGDGVSMIVMELLVGRPLTEQIAEGPLSPELTRGYIRQIASGMAAAHGAGIVHGDLKPANVFLTEHGTAKILDFGLAGRRHVSRNDESTIFAPLSSPASIAGTPAYMSPEQTDFAPPSDRSDVFALGLITYEMLTGRRMIDEDSTAAVLRRIRDIDAESFALRVEEPFRSLLQRVLIRDPAARRMTMSEVVAEMSA